MEQAAAEGPRGSTPSATQGSQSQQLEEVVSSGFTGRWFLNNRHMRLTQPFSCTVENCSVTVVPARGQHGQPGALLNSPGTGTLAGQRVVLEMRHDASGTRWRVCRV